MTETAGRDILIGWTKDREERDIYKAAIGEAEQKLVELQDVVAEEFEKIKAAHEADRAAWKKKLREARSPGFGFFAGAGFTSDGIKATVGLGLVWRVW